nr:hypothetical protein GCM10020093_057610 [Planobispora longispora]
MSAGIGADSGISTLGRGRCRRGRRGGGAASSRADSTASRSLGIGSVVASWAETASGSLGVKASKADGSLGVKASKAAGEGRGNRGPRGEEVVTGGAPVPAGEDGHAGAVGQSGLT